MNTWTSLRTTLDGLEIESGYKKIDPISQRILEWIAIRNKMEAPLHVQEIIMKSQVASPATVHKSLSALEYRGLITITIDANDTRRRIVTATAAAEKLLSKLSRGVEAWAKSVARLSEGRGNTLGR
ncbi:MAG: hypothetical protein FGM18_05785 [Burkholderiaceae bacterium]|nr:hypothetical protein [Burkholderiaceae bacterium]